MNNILWNPANPRSKQPCYRNAYSIFSYMTRVHYYINYFGNSALNFLYFFCKFIIASLTIQISLSFSECFMSSRKFCLGVF